MVDGSKTPFDFVSTYPVAADGSFHGQLPIRRDAPPDSDYRVHVTCNAADFSAGEAEVPLAITAALPATTTPRDDLPKTQ